jgi:hypothetical protein
MEPEKKLLESINIPADLRKVKEEELPQVCAELRQFIIDVVSEKGGHFGGSLGVVELTVALHYVLILLTTNWYGIQATRHTGTRYLQAEERTLAPTGFIRA